eukprot:Skav236126  [mRNA]  locus=scaffold900:239607:243203:- [translate_table: standard]
MNSGSTHGEQSLLRELKTCSNIGSLVNSSIAGEYFARAIEANDTLTLVDLSGNDAAPSVEQLRRIDVVVQRNRERLSAMAAAVFGGTIRRNERRERFALYNEEFRRAQLAAHQATTQPRTMAELMVKK